MTTPGQSLPLVDGVWLSLSALATSPTPVSIIREDGTILFHNQASCDLFRSGERAETCIGGNIRDDGPKDYFDERIAFLRELAREGKHGTARDVWQGTQYITQFRLLPHEPGETLRKFMIIPHKTTGHAEIPDDPEMFWFSPEHQDLGKLAQLSRRELEVLALVGEGMSAPQIATRLHRSEDTVNSHKAALLRKLGCESALQLAIIAQSAGLRCDDAGLFAKPATKTPMKR
jgi:DNA-binding CsgD family transcriptional regulator